MGFGNIVHGQKIKGLIYLAVEVAYVVFMAIYGVGFIHMLGSLGSVPQKRSGMRRHRYICIPRVISLY